MGTQKTASFRFNSPFDCDNVRFENGSDRPRGARGEPVLQSAARAEAAVVAAATGGRGGETKSAGGARAAEVGEVELFGEENNGE